MKAMTNIKPVVLYAGTEPWMHDTGGFGTTPSKK